MLIIHTASTFILKDIRQTKYSSPKRLLMFVAMGCFLWIWKPSRIFFNHQHLQSTKLKLLLVHLIISIQTTGVCSFSVALLCKTKWRTALFSFPPCWQTCLLYFLWKWIIKSVKHNEKKKEKHNWTSASRFNLYLQIIQNVSIFRRVAWVTWIV